MSIESKKPVKFVQTNLVQIGESGVLLVALDDRGRIWQKQNTHEWSLVKPPEDVEG